MSDQLSLELILGDQEVMEFSDGCMNSREVAEWLATKVSNSINDGIEILAVELKSTDSFIGYCGLTLFPNIDGVAETEIGYRLIPGFWGSGYATEAATAVRDYGFSELNLRRLIALIDPSNERSIRVAKKLGMDYEKDVLLDGYDHPDYLYAIHNSEI